MDRTPAQDGGLDKSLEEKLISMLKDGICDLYSAVAVLEANHRIQVDPRTRPEQHLYVVR